MAENNDRLRNYDAEIAILKQRISSDYIYASNEWKKQARRFCVKGITSNAMLQQIKEELFKAQREGKSLAEFKKNLIPFLEKKGWVNGDKKEIARRLKSIYNTNLATARAAAKWERIQNSKEYMPYLQYLPSLAENQRDEHKPFYYLVRPVDDEIWKSIYPPNGFGCKCRVRQLTQKEAEKELKKQAEENGEPIDVKDEDVEKLIPASFQHNHSDLTGIFIYAENQMGKAKTAKMLNTVLNEMTRERLGSLSDLVAYGSDLRKKYKSIFESEAYKKNPLNGILEVLKKEGVKLGGKINYTVAKGFENQTKKILDNLQILPSAFLEQSNKFGKVLFLPRRRGGQVFGTKQNLAYFYSRYPQFSSKVGIGDSVVFLPSSTPLSKTIHEFAHRLQFLFPEMQSYYQTYFEIKTQGEKAEKLSVLTGDGYKNQEITKKDGFAHCYFGKTYGKNLALEMMTMSFQYLLAGKPLEHSLFMKKDPELFNLTLALLVRIGK